MSFCETDNPKIAEALARFSPDVLLLFGYSHFTNWRALVCAMRWSTGWLILTVFQSTGDRPLLSACDALLVASEIAAHFWSPKLRTLGYLPLRSHRMPLGALD